MGTIMPALAIGTALAIGLALGAGLVLSLLVPGLRRSIDAVATRLEARLDRLETGVRLLEERVASQSRARPDPPGPDLASPDLASPDLASPDRASPAPTNQPAPIDPPHQEPSRRRRPDPTEVRRLAQRGRHSVEIAQLLDADVGEIELMLRLDAARAESLSVQRPAPAAPRS